MKKQGLKLLQTATITLALTIATGATASTDEPIRTNAIAQDITPEMSCGVCRMYPARYPKWQTQIIFSDGQMVPFDGNKDMFKYLLMMPKFSTEHTASDVATTWVKDFNSGEWLNGKDAFFVVGSDIIGAMGKELIPFQKKKSALAFQEKHQGTIQQFSEISIETVKSLGMQMGGRMKMGGKMMSQ